jgi:hypothetical protein
MPYKITTIYPARYQSLREVAEAMPSMAGTTNEARARV